MIVDVIILSFCVAVFGIFAAAMLLKRFRGTKNVIDILRSYDPQERGELIFRVGYAVAFLVMFVAMTILLLAKILHRISLGHVGAYVGIVGMVLLLGFSLYVEIGNRRKKREVKKKGEKTV